MRSTTRPGGTASPKTAMVSWRPPGDPYNGSQDEFLKLSFFTQAMLMSEYQYYEFRAIDKPLDKKQMEELRALSTRAEITPTSFSNEYSYGDFRGDPNKLMEKYFD